MKIKVAAISFIAVLLLLGITIISVSSLSLSRTNEVKGIWLEFEQHRNNKLNALITLRSELGYGGMIHHFKNYILRQKKSDADEVVSAIGGAKSALMHYKSMQLSSTEERALLTIRNTIDAYDNALKLIFELIKKDKTAEHIDNIVNIEDKPALDALHTLVLETQSIEIKNTPSRPLLLDELRTTMGYGGLIHNYKNYLLRSTPEALEQVNNDVISIHKLIAQYQRHDHNKMEFNALKKIEKIVLSYEEKVSLIKKLKTVGQSARAIDNAVIIDDTPALDGFNDLQRQIILKSDANADKLNQSLDVIQLSSQVIFYITLVSFFLLIIVAYWLVFNKIIQPIFKLTTIMSKLSRNNLSVTVSGTKQKTEIGEMARSVQIFKTNAIKKQQIEQELIDTNKNLEKLIHERTVTLETSEARLASLVENAVDAIVTINRYGIIQTFNSAAMAMFGYASHEVIGKNVKMLMPNPYRDNHDGYLANFMRTGEKKIIGIGREVAAQRKNGTTFPMELAVSEIDSNDENKMFTGIIRDISEKKLKELELQLTTEAANKANKAKSDFLSSMSHELRTPMNAVLGFSALLVSDTKNPLTEDQLESVEQIVEGGEHLLNLINDVLDLSKIEAGHTDVSIETVSIQPLISQICMLIYPQAEQQSITIENKVNDEIDFKILADYKKLKQVLLNFCSNAIKYNSDNGLLTISCEKTADKKIRLSVIDTGSGVPEELITTLFEPFNRLDKANSNIQGTGIGLTICKQLVEIMKGDIGVFRNPDQGLTCWVEFEEA